MRKITTLLALLLFVVSQGAFAQRTITGTVISNEDGLGMPGVTVLVKGTTVGTSTDINGNFSLNVPNDATIVVSFMGFKTIEQPVGNQTRFNFTLEPDVLTLGDVVVTALGIQRETKTLTYSAQQISGEEMMQARDINFMGALQGKAAGLNIQTTSAGAGGSSRVILRGAKSFNSASTPLYVIDGVPLRSQGGSSGSGWSTYDVGDALSQMNPEDIESISVLKGANAAMLYGSQGANGVIMITTKKGQAGTVNVSLSNATSFSMVSIWPELQYKYGAKDGIGMSSWSPTPLDESGFKEKDMKDFFQTGNSVQNNISINAGAGNVTTLFSYGNTFSRGIIPDNTYRRDNVSLRQSAKLFNNKVTISTSIMLANTNARNRMSTGMYMNPLTGLYWFPRNLNISEYRDEVIDPKTGYPQELPDYGAKAGAFENGLAHGWRKWDPNRSLYQMNWHTNNHHQSNPWWNLYMIPRWDDTRSLQSSVNVTWDITNKLKFATRGSFNYNTRKTEQQWYSGGNQTNVAPNGTWSYNQSLNWDTFVDAMFTYNDNFGDFSLTALAGASYQERSSDKGFSVGTGGGNTLFIPNVWQLSNIPNNVSVGSTGGNMTIKGGAFANATIGFKEMIFLDLSGRNDWSSTLAGADIGISYFYPAAGISAIISQMVSLPSFITFGKARVSYTTVANDLGFDQIFYQSRSNITGQGTGRGTSVASRPDWTDAKPELNESLEIGTDWRFLEGKIGFDFTYYNNVSTNQRLSVTTPQGLGFSSRYMNVGRIVNNGVELLVDAEPVATGGFSWKTAINFATNKNEVKEIRPTLNADGEWTDLQIIELSAQDAYKSFIRVGGAIGDLYTNGFTYVDDAGKINTEGKGRLRVGKDGKPVKTGSTNPDFKYMGSQNPDFTLGWTNNFKYKRWSMGFLINGTFGGVTMSWNDSFNDVMGVSKRTGDVRDKGGMIRFEDVLGVKEAIIVAAGDPLDGQILTEVTAETWFTGIGDRNGVLEHYVYDRTNVRFTQFSLSYDLPVRAWNLPLRSASVGITGQNLFFLYNKVNYDPDMATNTGLGFQAIEMFNLPPTRTLGFNIRLNF